MPRIGPACGLYRTSVHCRSLVIKGHGLAKNRHPAGRRGLDNADNLSVLSLAEVQDGVTIGPPAD